MDIEIVKVVPNLNKKIPKLSPEILQKVHSKRRRDAGKIKKIKNVRIQNRVRQNRAFIHLGCTDRMEDTKKKMEFQKSLPPKYKWKPIKESISPRQKVKDVFIFS